MSSESQRTGQGSDAASDGESMALPASDLRRRRIWISLAGGISALLVVMCLLLRENADPTTQLCRAAYDGNLRKVRRLIESHPELINLAQAVTRSPRRGVIIPPPPTTRDVLLSEWRKVKERYIPQRNDEFGAMIQTGCTPLHFAAHKGRSSVVEFLLSKGADIHSTTSFGIQPLQAAVGSGNEQTVALLLAKGASIKAVNQNGHTALHLSAMVKSRATAEVLLKNGTNINAADNKGRTPLWFALQAGDAAMIKFLQDNGAK